MRLSIIVPVYNMAAEDKLKHCLDSLLAQTAEDFEIIAVDDASSDASPQILKEYEKQTDKLKVIFCKENRRQGGARNRGLIEARGEWVGFVDSDDFVDPQMYAKLLKKAEETGADVVGCDYSLVTEYTFTPGQIVENNTTEQTGVLDIEKHRKWVLRSGSMVVKIYKRELLTKNKLTFPEGIFYEDNCASPLWSLYFTHFERVPEPLYYYLTVADSTTHSVSWAKCLDRVKAGELFLKECWERGFLQEDDRSYRDEIMFRFSELAYIITLFSYMYSGKHRNPAKTAYLRRMILKEYPELTENPYFDRMVPKEDRKLVRLHLKSNLIFFVYYILLFTYRGFRKSLKRD
ncbi:MAG: glycosyltransferase family 2 protein [Lachnospiraceae bacterium]|nr:glycosyltransferase family 2 protein [Lachnospiraceae bacterium]